MIKEFKYYSETYLSENDIITKIDSEKGKFEIKKSIDNKWEINYHDLNSKLFSSVDFSKYIYNEIKNKYFYPMIVEYKNKIINIENKKNILKELNNATFEYFKKIPQKIKETNHVLKTLKILKIINLPKKNQKHLKFTMDGKYLLLLNIK